MRKRIISLLTAAACSAGLFWYLPPAPVNTIAAEIVSNDFETTYGGWYEDGDTVTLHAESGLGINGSRGMKVTGRALLSGRLCHL